MALTNESMLLEEQGAVESDVLYDGMQDDVVGDALDGDAAAVTAAVSHAAASAAAAAVVAAVYVTRPLVDPTPEALAKHDASIKADTDAVKARIVAAGFAAIPKQYTTRADVERYGKPHPEQILAALQIMEGFFVAPQTTAAASASAAASSAPATAVIIHLSAAFQSGKTGIMYYLARLCAANEDRLYLGPDPHHGPCTLFLTGLNDTSLKDQTKGRMLPGFAAGVFHLADATASARKNASFKQSPMGSAIDAALSREILDSDGETEQPGTVMVMIDEARIASESRQLIEKVSRLMAARSMNGSLIYVKLS